MKNTHLLILALQLFVPVKDFNVFDVGSNKKRVNIEDIEQRIARNIPNRIRTFEKFLDDERKSFGVSNPPKIQLAIPGLILQLLKKNHPSEFNLLKNLIADYKIELLLSTFYNTSLKIINDVDLAGQLLQEKDFIKRNFGLKAELFFTNDHHLSKKISLALKRAKVKGIIFANNGNVSLLHYTNSTLPVLDLTKGHISSVAKMHTYSFLHLGNDSIKKELHKLFSSVEKRNFISCSELIKKETSQLILQEKESLSNEFNSELEKHLVNELQMMYPHIIKSGDEGLLETWRLLANKELISYANPELASQDHNPYDYYANVMHVMNDMAHTIISVENVRRGRPQIKATIHASPSAFIQEQLFSSENNSLNKFEKSFDYLSKTRGGLNE